MTKLDGVDSHPVAATPERLAGNSNDPNVFFFGHEMRADAESADLVNALNDLSAHFVPKTSLSKQ